MDEKVFIIFWKRVRAESNAVKVGKESELMRNSFDLGINASKSGFVMIC